jgi:hypothetical protein
MQIVQGGHPGHRDEEEYYNEFYLRQPCGPWSFALIIDGYYNVYVMDIRLDFLGTYWGWCYDLYSGF